jgi:hypothetical protein
MAEIVALAEWREKYVTSGMLSIRDLLERARPIERLLEEREWREHHLFQTVHERGTDIIGRRLLSNVFYHGTRVLLTVTIDGSHPEGKYILII